jgi:hypothetical protein
MSIIYITLSPAVAMEHNYVCNLLYVSSRPHETFMKLLDCRCGYYNFYSLLGNFIGITDKRELTEWRDKVVSCERQFTFP